MRTGYHHNCQSTESAVANLIEYIMVSGVCMGLLIVMLLLVNTNIMENPANRVVYVAFTDIGNGVSTRMVDIYSLAPANGTITSKFDIPDEIVGRSYFVEIVSGTTGQDVIVSHGDLNSRISLAGIGATTRGRAGGNTTGAGMNIISFNSTGGL
ncbi:MAG: hypothetical protein Q7V05_06050 [Methanoregula sp.]|nr:hypothetical protein [Methanoregula sp.]